MANISTSLLPHVVNYLQHEIYPRVSEIAVLKMVNVEDALREDVLNVNELILTRPVFIYTNITLLLLRMRLLFSWRQFMIVIVRGMTQQYSTWLSDNLHFISNSR